MATTRREQYEGWTDMNPCLETPVWRCAACDTPHQDEPLIEHDGRPYCSEHCWKLDQDWRDAVVALEKAVKQRDIAVGYCLVLGLCCVVFAAIAWDNWIQYSGWLKFQQIKESLR